ncbi:hypothetical protein AB0I55_09115 [Actinocatenispora sera]|uniref:hypothetical protein n=1 Tax=Actinocatenispora sera TaxID=390989 RepID=UPI0033E540D6
MPTSVLLAVLAAAGLLALAPALVRRYDTTERQVAEREWSTARVVTRRRRRCTVPGHHPVNPPRRAPDTAIFDATVAHGTGARTAPARTAASGHTAPARTASGGRTATTRTGSGARRSGTARPDRRQHRGSAGIRRRRRAWRRLRRSPFGQLLRARPILSRPAAELDPDQRRRWWRYHRRRILVFLLALLLLELAVGLLVPASFVAAGGTVLLLGAYVVHLRNRALGEARHRREQLRRAAEERARAERAERARAIRRRRAAALATARRAAETQERLAALAAARAAEAELADGTYGAPFLRGRPYQARAAGF